MDLTFENLPKAISQLSNEIVLLRQLICQNEAKPVNSEQEMLNVIEAASILRLHPTTVSQKLKKGELPGQKKGKIWYIFKNDLFNYLRQSEHKSFDELAIHADDFLAKKN